MASAATVNDFKSLSFGDSQCRGRLTELFTKVAVNVLVFFVFAGCCNAFHFVLKPFSQPRITTDTFVGLVIGNLGFIHRSVNQSVAKTLRFIVDFGMICYMFVLGIEMEPQALFRPPTKDAKVAYAGMASTFALVCAVTPFLHYTTTTTAATTLALAAALSSTGSPVLTRLVTSLKIGKSDIGRLVIAAGMHSDFVSTLALSLGFIVFPVVELRKTFVMVGALAFQTLVATAVAPILVNWVNNENPEGKPMKGSHLILALAFMILVCCVSPAYGYNPMLSAFVAGVCLPRQGRLSRWVVSKINYLLNTIFYPIFFFWMGFEAQLGDFEASHIMTWVRLFVLFIVVTLGKVVGTVVSGAMLGFNWPESVAIGLLLTTKGHFHIYLAIASKTIGKTSASTSAVMIIVTFFTVVHAPWVIAQIIKRARKRAPTHHMSLELLDPSSELRVLACLHGPHNVPAVANLVEISCGGPTGAVVYITDMVELTSGIAATLVKGDGPDTVTVTDPTVVRMREEVNASVEAYKAATSLEGLAIRRMLALSTFTGLPQDVCILAEDLMTALILLPFHKNAATNAAHSGFRYVNRKVLRNAPCSVGILVDRGLGTCQPYAGASSPSMMSVAVIFIGGKDDREALAFSGRVARHPGVKLTVVRFVADGNNNPDNAAGGNYRHITMSSATEQEEETALDDARFAEFYERHVAGSSDRHVAYAEKHLANSAETLLALKSFEGQYSLVIVGRGGRVNSLLTFGMSDWQQCPELGPVGDVLSGADFAASMSVLVIQRHDPKGELDGLDDEFSIM